MVREYVQQVSNHQGMPDPCVSPDPLLSVGQRPGVTNIALVLLLCVGRMIGAPSVGRGLVGYLQSVGLGGVKAD